MLITVTRELLKYSVREGIPITLIKWVFPYILS